MSRMAVSVAMCLAICAATGAARQNRRSDTVVQLPSASLGDQRSVAILLPTDYATSKRTYPVLYLLHGGGQDHMAFADRPWFQAQASRGVIIVTPNAKTLTGGDSWYVNSVAEPSAKYEDFIVKDVITYVDTHYRTVSTRDGRAIAGVSMGAWGAMMLGLRHHSMFSAIGAFSAPYGISRQAPDMDMTSRTQQRFGAPNTPERMERDPAVLAANIPVESVPLLYLASGAQDLFVRDNRAFVARLAERKISYEYRELSPLAHSWDVWDSQITTFLDVLSRKWSVPKW